MSWWRCRIDRVDYKPSRDSIFARLLGSPWWVSAGIALLLLIATIAALPPALWAIGVFAALVFLGVAVVAAVRQWRNPSSARVQTVAAAVGAMQWTAFARAIRAGFERDGCRVEDLQGGDADFALAKDGRIALVSARRWKAAHTGIDPVRRLDAARQSRGAHEGIYIALGEISAAAQQYAAAHHISFLTAPALAKLLRDSDI
jgi:restriction system protein